MEGIDQITQGKFDYKLNLEEYQGDEYQLAEGINHISEGLANAIGESVRDERMKANMITNISHDIKTPLIPSSIILVCCAGKKSITRMQNRILKCWNPKRCG